MVKVLREALAGNVDEMEGRLTTYPSGWLSLEDATNRAMRDRAERALGQPTRSREMPCSRTCRVCRHGGSAEPLIKRVYCLQFDLKPDRPPQVDWVALGPKGTHGALTFPGHGYMYMYTVFPAQHSEHHVLA